MRQAKIERNTTETKIQLELRLDGSGKAQIDTGVGFFNHMLDLFTKHSRFDLCVTCDGDRKIDDHHSVEDIGIALGQAFASCLGNKKGIRRYGSMFLPMDESLILCALDLSGRSFLRYDIHFQTEKIGNFDTQLVREFWEAFTREAKVTLHVQQYAGENSHHIAEAIFKSVARSLRMAVSIDPELQDEIPSTKGVL